MAKAGRRAQADFATADGDLRSASVAPLLGHPDRMIERLQWMTDTLDFAILIVQSSPQPPGSSSFLVT
jgi:hypothetical protein